MFRLPDFPHARPRFPDRITVQAPLGLRTRVRQAAEAARTTPAERIRDAIERRVAEALTLNFRELA